MHVRRDQLALGAVAAALLLGIVVFAANTSVRSDAPGRPTPTPTSGSERDLFGGSLEPGVRYRTRAFQPPLSFVVGDTEWLVEDATQPDHLILERRVRSDRPGSELPSRSALEFTRVLQLIDPATGRLEDFSDLHAALARHPDLVVGPSQPVIVAGEQGESFAVTVRFSRPAQAAPECRPLLIVCTEIAPGRFYPDGMRMRMIVLPRPRDAPLVIDVAGQTRRDLDKIEAPAADVLRTLRIDATGP